MSAFAKCTQCNARVLIASGNTECERHRPRASREGERRSYDPEKRARSGQARRRRKAAAGVLWA